MADKLLEVNKINVFYNGLQVLWDISLNVEEEEIVSLVGPNGAGKTTVLKTIQGLIHPSNGEIKFLGKRIEHLSCHERVDMGITYVPEKGGIFLDMTVRENLELGAYSPASREKRDETLEYVYELFPMLKEKESKIAGSLSGGMQRMLAIGKGLMSRAKILLLDDPFLGLAPKLILKLYGTIMDINEAGVAILLVGQHVSLILNLSDRAYLMEAGRITLEGRGEELLNDEHLRRTMFGV
ncbi:MAG: ABC transporter ATP-binding protein [Candidatus Hydrothermarchaeota archaeon]